MAKDREGLQRLLEKVYRERGFDFRGYRESTLARRLGRRLRARGVNSYAEYGRVLTQDSAEYDKLFDCVNIRAKLDRGMSQPSDAARPEWQPMKEDRLLRISGARKVNEQPVRKVVVVAASAGGISALAKVPSRLPADLAAAVVIAQHLHPDRKSHFTEYLSSHSPLRHYPRHRIDGSAVWQEKRDTPWWIRGRNQEREGDGMATLGAGSV